jgi:hypothetical protein
LRETRLSPELVWGFSPVFAGFMQRPRPPGYGRAWIVLLRGRDAEFIPFALPGAIQDALCAFIYIVIQKNLSNSVAPERSVSQRSRRAVVEKTFLDYYILSALPQVLSALPSTLNSFMDMGSSCNGERG